MRVLWITNILFPEVMEKLTGEKDLKATGGWMALDGGRVVLLGVEAIRRKPLPPKVEAGINAAGLALLLGLMLLVSMFDIGKLFN